MEPVLFVMAILGCGESAAPCREVAVTESRYQTEAACLAATEAELARRDVLSPVVVAQCRREGARPQFVRGGGPLPEAEPTTVFERTQIAARSSR